MAKWQYATPQWNAMAFPEMLEELGVDRIVFIEILEYRLNPLGNRWEWQGHVDATVGVIEADSFDPEDFDHIYTISATFPDMDNLARDDADGKTIETGLLNEFIRDSARLFYGYMTPKYPDKYNPVNHPDVDLNR
jgi:hypothetical protein